MTARVVIVGGGITGLSAAHHILRTRPDVQLSLLESRDRLGGNIVTEQRDGFVIDGGPDSFLVTKPDAVRLCEELGLSGELIQPREAARNVYMVHRQRLELMPAGMVLAVPTRLGPMIRTPILSPGAKLRVLGDLLLRPGSVPEHADESVEAFIVRHFGRQTAERVAGPLLGGIYAGNIAELSMHSTFPQLVKLEKQYGSVIFGFFKSQIESMGNGAHGAVRARELLHLMRWLRREEQHKPSPFRSFRNGVATLVDALAQKLGPERIRLAAPVRSVVRDASGAFRVNVDAQAPLTADAVILAAPAHAAAQMIEDAEARSELEQIRFESTATVFLAFERAGIEHALDASGFIVLPNQAQILAATWVTSKWEHRAPADRVLIRAFLGGARDPSRVAEASDEALVALALRELERLMGRLGTPLFTRVFRYVKGSPQPVVGHAERIQRIERRLARTPGLYIAGGGYDGVGIPDCIGQGRRAAERALSGLSG